MFSTVSALLHIANSNPDYRAHAFGAIVVFATKIVDLIKTGEGRSAQQHLGMAF